MHRFFVDYKISEKHVIIHDTNDVNHIKRALRVQIGEKLEICDSTGVEYIVEVIEMTEHVMCRVLKSSDVLRESPVEIHLYQGLAKGNKMDTIVQKSVELGVNKIFPLLTKRSIVKLDAKSSKKKVERWQKISDEAAKQSKRAQLPVVESVIDLSDLHEWIASYDLVLVAYELEQSRQLKECLKGSHKKIAVVIGPEGGFEEDEIHRLIEKGAISTSLGPRILRTETAGMMLLSIIQYELGDVSGGNE